MNHVIILLFVLLLIGCATAVEMGVVYEAWQDVPTLEDLEE